MKGGDIDLLHDHPTAHEGTVSAASSNVGVLVVLGAQNGREIVIERNSVVEVMAVDRGCVED